MKNKTYGWVLVLILLLFAAASIYAYHKNNQRALTVPTSANLALYTNDTYGYSFNYPVDYTVRVFSEENIIVGKVTDTGFAEYAQAVIATSSPTAASYDEFIQVALQQLCTKHAGTCTAPPERKTYTSDEDLAGMEYRVQLTRNGATTGYGPFVAYNIGANVKNAPYAALIVYRSPESTGDEELFPPEDLARMVSIQKVEN